MSKNFELLRQTGWMQQYFDGIESDPPAETVKCVETRFHASSNEQICQLVRRVFLNSRAPHVCSVLFSSASANADCTQTCAQSGKALASLVDAKVCVVDANLDAPSLHREFGDDNLTGFSDAVFQSKPAKLFVKQVEATNLYFLAAGDRQAYSASRASEIAGRLQELRGNFDYLLVLAPPAGSGRSMSSLGRACDGAVLILETSGVALDSILKVRAHLKAARVPLFGVVLSGNASSSTFVSRHVVR